MRSLFMYTLFVVSLMANAQPYTVSGTVVDEEGKPMAGASVVNRASLEGTAADDKGRFSLSLKALPAYLEVTFIGYYGYYAELTREKFQGGELELLIRLKPRSEQLAPVLIEGKRYEEFFTYPGFEVLDFTFVDDNTLLLLKYGSNYKLALINEAGDSLMHLPLHRKASGFVKDCLQHVYLGSGDSLYALSFGQKGIVLLGALPLDFYVKQIKPCVAANANNLYYQFYKGSNQWVETYQSPMAGGGESRLIHNIADREDIRSREEYYRRALTLSQVGSKKGFEMMSWYNNVLNVPAYNPLFALRRGALLFDHLNDSLLVLDKEGHAKEKYEIKHHRNKHFKNEILRDAVTGRLYARYAKGGMTSLRVLSEDNFAVNERFELLTHDFPTSLKIRNGIAYYLDHSEDDYSRLKLYRQKLR